MARPPIAATFKVVYRDKSHPQRWTASATRDAERLHDLLRSFGSSP
jgi:hypothetical protein